MAYRDVSDPRNKAAHKKWYDKNKHRYVGYNRKVREAISAYITEAKPCADCGEEYPPYVMDFDHRPGEEKREQVSFLARRGSLRLAQEEIAKCDVVCSNCHRIRTHKRRQQKRSKIQVSTTPNIQLSP